MSNSRSKLIRVHSSFANEIDKIYFKNNRKVSKVQISKELSKKLRRQKFKPVMEINYWPLKKKVKIFTK